MRHNIRVLRNKIYEEEDALLNNKVSSRRLLRLSKHRQDLTSTLALLKSMDLIDRPEESMFFIVQIHPKGVLASALRTVMPCEDVLWARQMLTRENHITATPKNETYLLKSITTDTKQAA